MYNSFHFLWFPLFCSGSGYGIEVFPIVGRLPFFSPLQVFGFLEDDVKHFVVILGSIFFSVIFDFFGENRTK